jgi:hypothetical protein
MGPQDAPFISTNWSGYDSILSLGALLSHHDSGLKFLPVVRDGRIISLEVSQVVKGKNTRLLIIKDSFKLLPSAPLGPWTYGPWSEGQGWLN